MKSSAVAQDNFLFRRTENPINMRFSAIIIYLNFIK